MFQSSTMTSVILTCICGVRVCVCWCYFRTPVLTSVSHFPVGSHSYTHTPHTHTLTHLTHWHVGGAQDAQPSVWLWKTTVGCAAACCVAHKFHKCAKASHLAWRLEHTSSQTLFRNVISPSPERESGNQFLTMMKSQNAWVSRLIKYQTRERSRSPTRARVVWVVSECVCV